MFITCDGLYITAVDDSLYLSSESNFHAFCKIEGGKGGFYLSFGNYYLCSTQKGTVYLDKTLSINSFWIIRGEKIGKNLGVYYSLYNVYNQFLSIVQSKLRVSELPTNYPFSHVKNVELIDTYDWFLETFKRDGVAIMKKNSSVWNNTDIDSLKNKLQILEDDGKVSRVDLNGNNSFSYLLENNDKLALLLAGIFRGNNRCATFSSHTLQPGEGNEHWHNDYPYHNLTVYPDSSFVLGVQVMWLLDDFTIENGATRYIPASHHNKCFPSIEKLNGYNRENDRFFEAEKGDVVFMHAAMWHTVSPNTSNRSRSCLLSTFVPSWVANKD